MREILFRGKRVDNGKWTQGTLAIWGDDYYIAPDIKNAYTSMGGRGKGRCMMFGHYYQVIPETVGQYTGFIDKNGKKVFEDDVIYIGKAEFYFRGELCHCIGKEIYEERKALVTFSFDAFIADFAMGYDYFETDAPLIREIPMKCAEVIGNIHDNPELLEADK